MHLSFNNRLIRSELEKSIIITLTLDDGDLVDSTLKHLYD